MHAEKTSEAWSCAVALSKTQTVKDLFTPKGNCKGCGECCSRFLPMSEFDIQRLSNYVFNHNVKPHMEVDGAIDLTCPYLDENKECAVYTARPEVCRVYRCDKQVRGELLDFYGWSDAKITDMWIVAKSIAAAHDDFFGTSDTDKEPCGILKEMED
jgi:hypothetical protein